MCGIAGIVGRTSGPPVSAKTLRRMCDTIVHRGPDAEGIYVKGTVGLGMRRLSIIDVSGGSQPIHNEDKTLWIVFNGEIYNFLELRSSLEHRGHTFYTNTDTEAILHLYEEYGSECVHRLRGMFAFALYDERSRKLLLARDRLGKKPLHYALVGEQLLFGSEIKAILDVAPDLAEIQRETLLDYFYFGYILDPQTAFTHIQKLPPGHLLEYTEGGLSVRKYWDLPQYGTLDFSSEEECLEELERILTEAVRIRLISDVPLGALLSGGVDSSIVVALMARANASPLKTFSIGFSHEEFNETSHADRISGLFGTEHRRLTAEPNFEQTLDFLTHLMEEPFGDASMLPTYHVCALARQHVTVALAGDGGDELFAGYDRYSIHLGREAGNSVLRPFGPLYRAIYPHLPEDTLGRNLLYNLSLPTADRYLDSISHVAVCSRDRRLFSGEFLAWADRRPSPFERFREILDEAPAKDELSRLQYLDIKTYLAGDILTKVDRMSMATSLEVRAPMLDHILAEWAARLVPRWKFYLGERKYILKRLAVRLGIPPGSIYRPKQGFALPLTHWMRHELRDAFLEILREARTLQRGYFSRDGIERLLSEHQSGRRDRSGSLWTLLVFELWHRNFLEALPYHTPSETGPGVPLRLQGNVMT